MQGTRYSIWNVPRESAPDVKNGESVVTPINFTFVAPEDFSSTGELVLLGHVKEADSSSGDDLIGDYNNTRIAAAAIFGNKSNYKFDGDDRNSVTFYLRMDKV